MWTKAMPLSSGTASMSWRSASSPPADAPMPTTSGGAPGGALVLFAAAGAGFFFRTLLMAGLSVRPGCSGRHPVCPLPYTGSLCREVGNRPNLRPADEREP